MAAPTYVVRRSPGCSPSAIEATINGMVAEGMEIVAVTAHSTYPPPQGHDGRTCVIDVIGRK
jgi:hypothetical protein